MKFLSTQLAYFLSQRQMRQNIRALLRYLIFVMLVIIIYAVLFHVIKQQVEGEDYSWITGFYWTLTVMSTLGFGDITFHSDIGRFFSIIVLLSGIVLLLIMLPFAFIRYFYAPWLEAQISLRAPRRLPEETSDHVIICAYDSIAPGLIERLDYHHIPYCIIEPDPVRAAQMVEDGISVVTGEVDAKVTYERVRADQARLVFVNREDTTNSNIVLTLREVDPNVAIIVVAEHEESIDILELCGATHVLPLKQRLGEQLANRVNLGLGQTHLIGTFKDVQIAEFPVYDTPLSGHTLRETKLREKTGVSVVGVWEQGRLLPAHPDRPLSDLSVPMVVGTAEQIEQLDGLLVHQRPVANLVLIIGGGRVGTAAVRVLKQRGIRVHMVERDEALRPALERLVDHLVIGDAAERTVVMEAGLEQASAAMITTNDDAANIYLSIYCRRLNPKLRIITRITHERNLEAIHRAGADLGLSYASLGVESVFSRLQGRELVLPGDGVEFFMVPVPLALVGKTLAESRIGERTHLIVIAVETDGKTITNPVPSLELTHNSQLLMVGTTEQRQTFAALFDT